jgi:hypothetical protein
MTGPRKRAQTKPADPQAVVETPEPLPEQPDADEVEAAEATAAEVEVVETPSEPDPPAEPETTKSDLQKVETPCSECFASGWADGIFAVGCEHGTWSRN